MRDRLEDATRVPDGEPMTTVDACGCVDGCETKRPVFLGGGDELAVKLRDASPMPAPGAATCLRCGGSTLARSRSPECRAKS